MTTLNGKQTRLRTGIAARALVALMFGICTGLASAQDADDALVSQVPLSAGGSVPSNVVLTPSVEFPTINSKANLGAFNVATLYNGYFDSYKCYTYHYDSAVEAERYFEPTGTQQAVPAQCSAALLQWSGNYLNWAATQTIDPFRKALTGGLRHTDTATTTILEKARHDGQGGLGTYFPVVNINANVGLVSPADAWTNLRTRVENAGNRLLFSSGHAMNAEALPGTIVEYDPSLAAAQLTAANAGVVYSVVVRVKVCVEANGLEPNCVAYGANYKPEGLIQKYQKKMRFSVFGYLLDNGMYRDGGVLRANQKFVGPEYLDPSDGEWKNNDLKEWDGDTGVLFTNPNPADATATTAAAGQTVSNSGVINYINKFGQLTGTNAKNFDPVSELYYTATRYLRNLDPVATYNDLTVRYDTSGGTAVPAGVGRWNLTDGFPVVTEWDDPYQYWCQNTAIIGIGDVYTHRDKNLPGSESSADEPTMPGAVSSDPSFSGTGNFSVSEWSRKAYALEGIDYNSTFNNQNSPYIVGLAYYTHTQDMRPDLGSTATIQQKRQTASTHWVDVRENQRVEPRERNQYWMAAKYGGFLVPVTDVAPKDGVPDFDSETHNTAFPAAWWDSGETLTSNSSNTGAWPNDNPYPRTSNFYVADKPDTMISGLSRAFAKFGSESLGSGASLAANSTRLDTTTLTFQAQFQNSIWLGQLNAYKVDRNTGAISAVPLWSAGTKLNATNWGDRPIHVNADGDAVEFEWDNLTTAQQAKMNDLWDDDLEGEDVVNYIRGDETLEEDAASGNGVFRTRSAPQTSWSTKLGDIVNSTPVFVGAPNPALYATSPGNWTGKSTHDEFASSSAQVNRLPVVWVGGNDGMLHAFDASITSAGNATATSGNEVYAFIPNVAIDSGLADYANPDYSHKYFVDGDIAVADVYTGGAWRTVLVATMGRGTPGIFALDVTDPEDVEFLWELDASDIASLGHNIGRPVIAQVADGDWRVLLGNGPDSAAGSASLITIKVDTGAFTTTAVDAGTANGLSAVLARDSDADGLSDVVYAGDLEGKLWKITNLTADTATFTTLFTARDGSNVPQPITAAPLAGRDPATLTTWVFFGTGKFLNEDDLTSTQTQTWYGIKDTGVGVARSDLIEREVTGSGDITEDHDNNPATPEQVIFQVRTVSESEEGDMEDTKGWYMDLPVSRERMVVPNRFQGSALIGTTRIPDASDACAPTGGGFIMAINPFTGARLTQTFFDANRDGTFDENDMLNGEIVSGLGIDSSPNNPIFIDNVMQFSKDDGTTDAVQVQGSSAEARRASWREVTN